MNDNNPIISSVPKVTADIIQYMPQSEFLGEDDLYELLVYKILSTDREDLAGILSAGEGLENKLKESVKKCRNMSELIRSVKSKRYTETRIHRLMAHTLIDLQRDDFQRIVEEKSCYARVLAISEKRWGKLLHIMKARITQ